MNFRSIVFTAHASIICSIVFGQGFSQQIESFISKKVTDYAKDYPGVSVSVIKGEALVYNRQFGYADLENKEPVSSTTRFNIYSTSKFITGLAFLKLVMDDKIDLDQKIRDIDPSLPSTYGAITIRHLLTHKSGISHYRGGKDWMTFAALKVDSPKQSMNHFINSSLKATPGEKEIYTTYGLVVASHILEKITGKNFQEAVNDLIPFTETLELDGFNKKKATPYVNRRKSFAVYPNLNAKSKYGGGGFIASSNLLAEAGAMLFNGKLGTQQEIKSLFKSQWEEGKSSGMAFGTGSGISNEAFGRPDVFYIAMGGGSPGGRSYLFVAADLQVSVAITANREGEGDGAYQLAKEILLAVGNGKEN